MAVNVARLCDVFCVAQRSKKCAEGQAGIPAQRTAAVVGPWLRVSHAAQSYGSPFPFGNTTSEKRQHLVVAWVLNPKYFSQKESSNFKIIIHQVVFSRAPWRNSALPSYILYIFSLPRGLSPWPTTSRGCATFCVAYPRSKMWRSPSRYSGAAHRRC